MNNLIFSTFNNHIGLRKNFEMDNNLVKLVSSRKNIPMEEARIKIHELTHGKSYLYANMSITHFLEQGIVPKYPIKGIEELDKIHHIKE